MFMAVLAAACGVGALYGSWSRRLRPAWVVNLIGWSLLTLSLVLWIRTAGAEYGPVFAILVLPVAAWLAVLSNTRVREPVQVRQQASLPARPELPAVIRHGALFVGAVPLAAIVSALLALAIVDLLPVHVVNKMALGVLAMPALWGLLAWWMCADPRPLRPAAALILGGVLCSLFLFG